MADLDTAAVRAELDLIDVDAEQRWKQCYCNRSNVEAAANVARRALDALDAARAEVTRLATRLIAKDRAWVESVERTTLFLREMAKALGMIDDAGETPPAEEIFARVHYAVHEDPATGAPLIDVLPGPRPPADAPPPYWREAVAVAEHAQALVLDGGGCPWCGGFDGEDRPQEHDNDEDEYVCPLGAFDRAAGRMAPLEDERATGEAAKAAGGSDV